MHVRKSLFLLCAMTLLVCGLALLLPQRALGIAPISGTWTCNAYASCAFTRTSSRHATYEWYFGDGSSSGLTTAVTTYHTYNIPQTNTPQQYTVALFGYATPYGGNFDNFATCTITTYRTGVGGDPTTFSGNCN